MVSHERQRRLVDIVAHRALHVVVDRLGETDDVTLRKLFETEVEGVLGAGEDESVPGNRFGSLSESLRLNRRDGGREGLEVGVSDGGEGAGCSRIAAAVSGALALFRCEAGDGSGAVDRARLKILLAPRHSVAVRRVADLVRRRRARLETGLELVDAVMLGAEVLATLDGESRLAECGTTVFGGVGDLRSEESCEEIRIS